MFETVVLAGRTAAEALMTETCVVTRQSGVTYNSETYQEEPVYAEVYAGRCRVQTRAVMVIEADAGGTEHGVVRWEVQVPIANTADIRRGDTVTITAAALEPALAGMVFTVQGPHVGSQKTARRLPVTAEVD